MKGAGKTVCGLVVMACQLCFTISAIAASPPPLEVYGALPKTESVELSPDGTMLAMVSTEGDRRVLSIQKVDGKVLSRAGVGDLKLSGLRWAGNDYVIVYLHTSVEFELTDESEFAQAVIVSVKDGSTKPMIRRSPDHMAILAGSYGFAQDNGRWYGYVGMIPTIRPRDGIGPVGEFKQSFPDLYRVDLETGSVAFVSRGSALEREWVINESGKILAQADYEANNGEWRVSLPGSEAKPLATGKSPYRFGLLGRSHTPDTVLLSSGGAQGDLLELHLDSGKTEPFLAPGTRAGLIRSPATDMVVGVVLADDGKVLMFDPGLDRRYRGIAKAFAGETVRLDSVSADLGRMVLHTSGDDTSGTWQLIDFTSGVGKATPIADDYPTVPDDMIGKAEMVSYRAADGMELEGVLTLPPGAAPHNLPVVVLPHGGPETRDSLHFDWWPQAFASRGYAVFQPNFRGSGGYGSAFRNAGFGEWGRKMQTDISDGVAMLAAKGVIDPKRACIVGASYGGYAALAGVTLQHGLYRCAASYGGIGDMRDMLYFRRKEDGDGAHHYSDPALRYWTSYLGVTSPDDPSLASVSPRLHADSADAPILLVYGQKDSVVPPKQSTDMASALEHAGKPVTLVELDGEDHHLSRSATRMQMLKAMVEFVEKYNPPH
jgi:dipeptidyl aminopeptidase/acylaminoacyl peptidase